LITSRVGVATIPNSVFYLNRQNAPSNYIRFCFAKKEATLQAGLAGLARLGESS